MFDVAHIPYAWAAYRRGAFDVIPDLEPDMDAMAFSAWLTEKLSALIAGGGEAIAVLADTPNHGRIPTGLAVIEYDGNLAYPHVLWYPDASPRSKLEATLAFMIRLKKNKLVLVRGADRDVGYLSHLCKYGVMRKVGKIRDYFADGTHATLFQSVGH